MVCRAFGGWGTVRVGPPPWGGGGGCRRGRLGRRAEGGGPRQGEEVDRARARGGQRSFWPAYPPSPGRNPRAPRRQAAGPSSCQAGAEEGSNSARAEGQVVRRG